VSSPTDDAMFAPVHENGSTPELKTWWNNLPSDITTEVLPSEMQGSDEFDSSL
jgi:hypothetical protein